VSSLEGSTQRKARAAHLRPPGATELGASAAQARRVRGHSVACRHSLAARLATAGWLSKAMTDSSCSEARPPELMRVVRRQPNASRQNNARVMPKVTQVAIPPKAAYVCKAGGGPALALAWQASHPARARACSVRHAPLRPPGGAGAAVYACSRGASRGGRAAVHQARCGQDARGDKRKTVPRQGSSTSVMQSRARRPPTRPRPPARRTTRRL